MLMALMVLLGFGVLFMFASDEGDGGQSIESVIARQASEIESLKASVVHVRKNLDQAPERAASVKELARLKREGQFFLENIGNLQKTIAAGKAEVARRSEAFEAYKDEYRAYARGAAKGEKMVTLETLTGVVYKNVSIREVTAIGIQIRHDDGHKRLPFEELPDAMRDRFQFDPKQKEKALVEESTTREKHEAAVAVASGLEDEKMAKQRAIDAEAAKEKLRREIAAKQSRINSLGSEIEDLNDALPMEAKKTVSRAGIILGQISNKRQEITELQAQISNMQTGL